MRCSPGSTTIDRTGFADFGAGLGLAFQIADDILDATATADDLGKSPGKDADAGKLTYVTLYGLDAARERLADLEATARGAARRDRGPGRRARGRRWLRGETTKLTSAAGGDSPAMLWHFESQRQSLKHGEHGDPQRIHGRLPQIHF